MRTIDELMTAETPRLTMYCTVEDAASAFETSGAEALAVCDSPGVLMGVLEPHHVAQAVQSMGDLAHNLRAQHLMTTQAPTIGIHDTVELALTMMASQQSQYLVVVHGSAFRGMITSVGIAEAETPKLVDEFVEPATTAGHAIRSLPELAGT